MHSTFQVPSFNNKLRTLINQNSSCKNARYLYPGTVRTEPVKYWLRLDDRMNGVRFPAGARTFPLHHRIQTGSSAHPASYRMGTWGSFPRETDHLHLVSGSSIGIMNLWSYASTPQDVFVALCLLTYTIRLHDLVLSKHRDNVTFFSLEVAFEMDVVGSDMEILLKDFAFLIILKERSLCEATIHDMLVSNC
jgi:hypothetical protein